MKQIVFIEDICDIKTGKLDANASSPNGLYPFFTCSSTPLRIDMFSYDEECVLIAGNGELNVKYYNGKFDAYQRTYIITLKKKSSDISIKYLYYFFLLYVQFLRKNRNGSIVKYIKKGAISKAKINIPSYQLQLQTISIIEAVFAKIDALKENAQKNLENANALFQQVLKQELTPKPNWQTKKLGEVGSLKNGINYGRNKKGIKINILGVGDFKDNYYIDDTKKLQQQSLEQYPPEDYLLKNEDVVFVRSNGNKQLVGRSVVVFPHDTPTTFSGFCIRFRKSTNDIDVHYLLHYLKQPETRKKLFGNGTNISNLNQGMLSNLEIPFPPLSEQKIIVSTLNVISEKCSKVIANAEKTIAECDALKQAVLRRAFNGEL